MDNEKVEKLTNSPRLIILLFLATFFLIKFGLCLNSYYQVWLEYS